MLRVAPLFVSILLCLPSCSGERTGKPASEKKPSPPAPTTTGGETRSFDFQQSWSHDQASAVLDRTLRARLDVDLTQMSEGEQSCVEQLMKVGDIFQRLYEQSLHRDALAVRAQLADDRDLGKEHRQALENLYRLHHGPIATTLDNKRAPFLPVEPPPPGRNVYPWGITRDEVDAFLAANGEARGRLLDPRTVVRRQSAANLARDLGVFQSHPGLALLHGRVKAELETLAKTPDDAALYAVPYSVAYADDMVRASGLLHGAADAIAAEDAEFAGYLRNRARDLLSNDYESGDASWVTGRFRRLNAQIGAYEVYDDALFGVKAFYSLNILARDDAATAKLRQAIGDLQSLEDSLPHQNKKTVRSDIPVGVYSVVADYGQSRKANTATILPNDSLFARRYGRTILLRANIMRHPGIFENVAAGWKAVVAGPHDADLTPDGGFERTLWHEVGHYLGPDRDRQGRTLDQALEELSSMFEEMKADLVSLFVARALRQRGYHDDAGLRAVYASGISRVLIDAEPRREQAYATMKLMQQNFFFSRGLLRLEEGELVIDYGRYHAAVAELLGEVVKLQAEGDKKAALAFVEQWTKWEPAVHGKIATKLKAAKRYSNILMLYSALGD